MKVTERHTLNNSNRCDLSFEIVSVVGDNKIPVNLHRPLAVFRIGWKCQWWELLIYK